MTSYLMREESKIVNKSEPIIKNSHEHSCILRRKKVLHPLLNATNTISSYNHSGNMSGNKQIAKRILSAKDHKLKQLQNQLADAHYHLNELTNENRLLRNLQKRMDFALQKYEGVNGDIPKIFNSHNEEIRSWQVRFKHLKNQLKETNQKLKNKEIEFQQLSDEHKHLLALSKDGKLYEREKLQQDVNEMSEKIEKQTETISNLQKKIHFEAKSLKHQLNTEIKKHKETQNRLNNALQECERLNSVVEKKDITIKSIIPKRNLKNDKAAEKTAVLTNFEKNSFYLNLIDNGKSTTDSHASIESSNKTENQSNFTFTVSENKFFSENDASSDSIIAKPMKKNELTDDSQSGPSGLLENSSNSNLDIKKRVDAMKIQLLQNKTNNQNAHIKSKRLPKSKTPFKKPICSSNSDSSPEEISSVASNNYSDQNVDVQTSLYKSQKGIVDDDNEYIDSDYLNDFTLDNIDKKCQELEENAARERFAVEAILENYTNSIIRVPEKNPEYFPSLNLEGVNSKHFDGKERKLEFNNNEGDSNSKKSSDLDEDKKKKLLATLKAIDCGDDDGLNIESIPKSKFTGKISKIN